MKKEYYRANNISVSDGTMKIKAQTEKVGSYNWTSGRIKSAGKVNIGYGYVEARIKDSFITGNLASILDAWN